MRINKYIAGCGICSRRKADELILAGQVRVNGAVMKEPGYDVAEGDRVTVEGKEAVLKEELLYYVLNKPRGYITTVRDEKGRPTVMDLMTDVSARVFPVGRLDYDSAGLIIMTNDGELSNHIAHPKNRVWKTYTVEAAGYFSPSKAALLKSGIEIDGRKTAPARIKILRQKGDMTLAEVQICEGRNRQIRKMFAAVGCKVTYLERTAIGEIKLGRLHEGSYRKLSPKEVEYLRNC